ncbi:divalent-cation tolerance protein CutA [Leptolyngbya sp. 'hensonii']|uniref:divalent-cation tolerance protein CutA n=1 Tax=Leptolyngbya sp. 'hensonii' TaxID=1922337 RepID=UPI00094F52D3|nr:divalent-cation tolerance protein CutA [Leptolyngbya sp. 'hensonii']OLP16793.1 divalent-cation tolerance protein CutA [Leptolyngbya sp. 'hensonii']
METVSPSAYCIVLVTTSSRQEAETIGSALVEARLAACVSLTPVHSIYTWQGEVHRDDEWQLMIKSEASRFEELAALVRSRHSYDVPEIIALPLIAGSPPYLQWISDQVRPLT